MNQLEVDHISAALFISLLIRDEENVKNLVRYRVIGDDVIKKVKIMMEGLSLAGGYTIIKEDEKEIERYVEVLKGRIFFKWIVETGQLYEV